MPVIPYSQDELIAALQRMGTSDASGGLGPVGMAVSPFGKPLPYLIRKLAGRSASPQIPAGQALGAVPKRAWDFLRNAERAATSGGGRSQQWRGHQGPRTTADWHRSGRQFSPEVRAEMLRDMIRMNPDLGEASIGEAGRLARQGEKVMPPQFWQMPW